MKQYYSLPVRLCHWATLILVAVQVSAVMLNKLVYDTHPILSETLVQTHISLGGLIFIVTFVRLGARIFNPAPALPSKAVLRWGAIVAHASLYICLFILPVTGYLRLAALGFEFEIFGIISLPVIELNTSLAAFATRSHRICSIAFITLVSAHVAAAALHQMLDGNAVLSRMGFKQS
ncbi:MAG: cytochrome b [Pelagimonas sp.]|uniref:cytochrome b n=1 Tax=Pelagimonas sp. TaxID=2073170 RepID=UPI003D6AC305